MLDILSAVEKELPELLKEENSWKSVFVDYHPPIVERLWRTWGEYRIYLHKIHPCERKDALFHPHPWPSAMRILSGEYEMAVGYGKGETIPPIAALMYATGNFRYEMTDPDAWHYVRPIDKPTVSLMVTGKPWTRKAPKSEKPLQELSKEQCLDIFGHFRKQYKRYKLLSPDGNTYESEQKGKLGGNKKDRIYGQLCCKTANAARKKGYVPVFFADEAAAIASGFRPCHNCTNDRFVAWLQGGESGSAAYPWQIDFKVMAGALTDGKIIIFNLIVLLGWYKSGIPARRAIEKGSVEIGTDRMKITDPDASILVTDGLIIRLTSPKIRIAKLRLTN